MHIRVPQRKRIYVSYVSMGISYGVYVCIFMYTHTHTDLLSEIDSVLELISLQIGSQQAEDSGRAEVSI